jgi:hypothetical protein
MTNGQLQADYIARTGNVSGAIWSFMRSVLSRGHAQQQDYADRAQGYERFSTHVDIAAREIADDFELILKAIGARPAALSAPERETDEIAWLIEWKEYPTSPAQPQWWTGRQWTTDANKAIRYSREVDAALTISGERYRQKRENESLGMIQKPEWADARATEHMWPGALPALPQVEGEET